MDFWVGFDPLATALCEIRDNMREASTMAIPILDLRDRSLICSLSLTVIHDPFARIRAHFRRGDTLVPSLLCASRTTRDELLNDVLLLERHFLSLPNLRHLPFHAAWHERKERAQKDH